jgi:hypothetical protein
MAHPVLATYAEQRARSVQNRIADAVQTLDMAQAIGDRGSQPPPGG